jgi:hypothetical protein
MSKKAKRALAVASGGGHWVQLRRVVKAFDGCDLAFITVNEAYRDEVERGHVYIVNDATRWNPFGVLLLVPRIMWIVLRERPDFVISTGAAPGCVAIILGRCLGSRTIWIDSIANVEKISLSAALVRRFTHLWLTQWAHLAREGGPEYAGKVF